MDYISDMQIKEIGTDVFVISTPVGKYLLDNVSASIAQLNNRIELENQVHMDALYKTLFLIYFSFFLFQYNLFCK